MSEAPGTGMFVLYPALFIYKQGFLWNTLSYS